VTRHFHDVALEVHTALAQALHGLLEVGHGEGHLGVGAGGDARGGEDHELGAAAEVAQPAVALLDGLEAELVGVPAAGAVQILRRKPYADRGVVERPGSLTGTDLLLQPVLRRGLDQLHVVPVRVLEGREPQPGVAVLDARHPRLPAPLEMLGGRLDVGDVVVEDEPAGLDGAGVDVVASVDQDADVAELQEPVGVGFDAERLGVPLAEAVGVGAAEQQAVDGGHAGRDPPGCPDPSVRAQRDDRHGCPGLSLSPP
jgi:hypothetical protein